MVLIKPELLTFKAVGGSSFALQQQAETLMRDPGEGLGASLGTGTASRAREQPGWHPGALCSRALLLAQHTRFLDEEEREGDERRRWMQRAAREAGGEERLALKSEIITANLGLKPEGNPPRGK